jgi:ABC-type nitrate/sulfonate/bicarbonate transport system substrate-binding protein
MAMSALKSRVSLLLNWYTNPYHAPIIVNKRVGYIGAFGKKIIDNLAGLAGIDQNSYETVRIGMNVTDAICRNIIDTGIGFINFQKIELEQLRGETVFLRIDQLAGLGCCCFCSVQFIVPPSLIDTPFWQQEK